MITYISILLGFLCLGILIYSIFLKSTNFRLISKIFCSLCFLLISITAYLNNPVNLTYFYLIFIGLLFSFLGDIFLGIKKSEPKFNYILFMLPTPSAWPVIFGRAAASGSPVPRGTICR